MSVEMGHLCCHIVALTAGITYTQMLHHPMLLQMPGFISGVLTRGLIAQHSWFFPFNLDLLLPSSLLNFSLEFSLELVIRKYGLKLQSLLLKVKLSILRANIHQIYLLVWIK